MGIRYRRRRKKLQNLRFWLSFKNSQMRKSKNIILYWNFQQEKSFLFKIEWNEKKDSAR